MAGQPSFFDMDERYTALSAAADPPERLSSESTSRSSAQYWMHRRDILGQIVPLSTRGSHRVHRRDRHPAGPVRIAAGDTASAQLVISRQSRLPPQLKPNAPDAAEAFGVEERAGCPPMCSCRRQAQDGARSASGSTHSLRRASRASSSSASSERSPRQRTHTALWPRSCFYLLIGFERLWRRHGAVVLAVG
jgi:hypothetical protein